jgi:hypothetical protein
MHHASCISPFTLYSIYEQVHFPLIRRLADSAVRFNFYVNPKLDYNNQTLGYRLLIYTKSDSHAIELSFFFFRGFCEE